jgi:hypothetical protein
MRLGQDLGFEVGNASVGLLQCQAHWHRFYSGAHQFSKSAVRQGRWAKGRMQDGRHLWRH